MGNPTKASSPKGSAAPAAQVSDKKAVSKASPKEKPSARPAVAVAPQQQQIADKPGTSKGPVVEEAPRAVAGPATVAERGSVATATPPEELPFLAKMINHIMTPGSSLTSSVWVAFNFIMVWLFLCWLLFVFSFPDNIHVWAFGILGLGLTITTNWFMSEIFKAGLDFDTQSKKGSKREEKSSKKALPPNGAEKKAKSNSDAAKKKQ